MADELSTSGLIFVSHASDDKDYVRQVLARIPKSHVFFDVETIVPGTHTVEALDDGLLRADVFALFVSPSTPERAWVEYEASIALIQKIRRKHLKVVVVPIKGSSFKTAPMWMQSFSATTSDYLPTDVARLLKHLLAESLSDQGLLQGEKFVGRETEINKILTDVRTRSAKSGVAPNFILLSGIENMGRSSLARHILSRLFPGSRTDSPLFDLPRHADAINIFLTLRSEIEG